MGLRTSQQPAPTQPPETEYENLYAEVTSAVNTVIQAMGHSLLTSTQISSLGGCLKEYFQGAEGSSEDFCNDSLGEGIEDPGYGPGFNLQGEFNNQIRTIRALQVKIQNPNGSIKDSISPREAKELITAGGSMLTSLLKHHKSVMSMERQRAIEAATIEAIKSLDEPAQETFYQTLEQALPKED